MSRLAYIIAFGGLLLWGGLIVAVALLGMPVDFPYSIVWVMAAALPALGIALLFLIATAGRDDEEMPS